MPLESRLTRKPLPVGEAAAAASEEAVSPRRRGLSTTAAAADAHVAPRTDDIDREEEIDKATHALAGGTEDPPEEEAAGAAPSVEPPAPALEPASDQQKQRKPRQARQKAPTPEGSPEDLREQLKVIEGQLKALHQNYLTDAKPLVQRYKEVSAALADSLLG